MKKTEIKGGAPFTFAASAGHPYPSQAGTARRGRGHRRSRRRVRPWHSATHSGCVADHRIALTSASAVYANAGSCRGGGDESGWFVRRLCGPKSTLSWVPAENSDLGRRLRRP